MFHYLIAIHSVGSYMRFITFLYDGGGCDSMQIIKGRCDFMWLMSGGETMYLKPRIIVFVVPQLLTLQRRLVDF